MSVHRYRCSPLVITAAFLCAHFCGASGAAELGRLFTTPEERSYLEKLRHPAPVATGPELPAGGPAPAERGPADNGVAVTGFVYRKSGRGTLWINNAHGRAQRLQVYADKDNNGNVRITIPDSNEVMTLQAQEMHHTKE